MDQNNFQTIKDRMPPHNLEAEQSVLGSLFIDSKSIVEIENFLEPKDFYNFKHQEIYQAVLDVIKENDSFDIVSISSKLNDKKKLDDVGGRSYLTSLTSSVPSSSNIKQYAKIVKDKSTLRKTIEITSKIQRNSFDENENFDKIISDSYKDFQKLYELNGEKSSNLLKPLDIKDIVSADYGDYEWIIKNLIPAQGITMISGRPKSGKSFLILYLLNQISQGKSAFDKMETKKVNVLLIDEENSKRGIARRARKVLEDDTNFKIMSLSAFKIDQDKNRELLKHYIKENEIKLVVFDSFRRIHSGDENSSEGVAKLYDCFKDIMTMDCAVLVIHHNRKISKFEKVDMESMRGSGDIGAMVDSFILLESDPLKDRKGNSSTITTVLREDYTPKPFQIEWFDEQDPDGNDLGITFEWKGEVEDDEIKVKKAQVLIEEIVKESEGISRKDLTEILKEKDIGANNTLNAIKMLEQKGVLDFFNGQGRQSRTKFYIYRNDNVLERTNEELKGLTKDKK